MDLRLASWNVRSLYRPGAIYQVTKELQRYRIGVAALQEVRWPGSGECLLENGEILFYSGAENGKHINGTGFVVDKNLLSCVTLFNPVSDRICLLRLKSKFFNITIVNAYAPTEISDEDTKDSFYEELECVCENIPEYDAKILIGDFNAKIGREEIFLPTIGKHSKHEKSNDNGVRLISFASSKSMVVRSTMFPHKDIYKGTWKSPDGITVNQIDHVLIDHRHKRIIEDIRTFRGADCDSDHYLIGAKVKAKIRIVKNKHTPREDIINVENLKNKQTRENFQLELKNRFSDLELQEDVDVAWEEIKTVVKEAGLKILGKKQRSKRRKWITKECDDLLEKRREFKIKAEQEESFKNEYEELRIKTKRAIKTAKRSQMESIVRNMEELVRTNGSRKFYNEIKNIKKGYQPTLQLLEDDIGNLVTDPKEIQGMWEKHFENLLNCLPPEVHIEDTIAENTQEVPPLNFKEVQTALMNLKNNKSPGIDNLPSELWKYSGGIGQSKFFELIVSIWNSEKIPEQWNIGIICPIHKKGSRRKCTNYRGITLLSTAYKVLSYVLLRRIEPYAETIIGDYQCGFRHNRSTVDQIFLLKHLMEKKWEYAQDVHSLFVDFAKAYDSVDRSAMYTILKSFNIPLKLIRMVEVATQESRAVVRVGAEVTSEFNVVTGLKQGDALSPMLFNLVLEYVIRQVIAVDGGVQLNGRHKVIGYADDLALLGERREEIVRAAEILEAEAKKVGLRVNADKTEYIHIRRFKNTRTSRDNLTIGGTTFKGTDRFKYLGCTITDTNTREEEIDIRVQNTLRCSAALHKVLVSRLLSKRTKIRIYKTVIRPILMYGCEAWVLTLKEENKLLVTERKVLRKILGPVKRDDETWRIRKNKELEELVAEPNIIGETKSHRLRWLGHLERMGDDRAVKRAYLGRPIGRRPIGRPRYRWKDEIEKDLRELQVENWQEVAQDRPKWRLLLSEAKTHFGFSRHPSK